MDKCAVIIAEDHYNALGVIRSIGKIGIPIYLIIFKNRNYKIINSKYINEYIEVQKNDDEILSAIYSYKNNMKKYIFPLSDYSADVIDRNWNKFDENYFVVPHAYGKIYLYQNKYYISKNLQLISSH